MSIRTLEELRGVPACALCLDAQHKGRVERGEEKKFPFGTHHKYDKAVCWAIFCDGCAELLVQAATSPPPPAADPGTATAVLVPAPTTMPALRKIVVGALRSDSDLRDEGIRRAHEIVIAHGKTLGRHARCGGLGMVIGLTGQVEPCGCRPNGVEHGCPDCAENDVDCLTFLDDDTVRCLTCGKEYRP